MVPSHELFQNILLHILRLNCDESVYELRDHVGEEALNSNLRPKLGLAKKILFVSFPKHLLENA